MQVELSVNGDMSFEDALQPCKDSLSNDRESSEEEQMTSISVEHAAVGGGRNDSNVTQGFNHFNQTEQQSTAVNAEKNSENSTNQAQVQTPDEDSAKVDVLCKEGCHVSERSLNKSALNEPMQPESPQILTKCTYSGCDYVDRKNVKQDDNEEDNQDFKAVHDAHCKEGFITTTSNSEAGFDPDESTRNRTCKTKHVVITVTRIECAAEEEVESSVQEAEEQSGASDCMFHEDKDERMGAGEDDKEAEEKRDAFSDFSTQVHQQDSSSVAPAHSPPPGSSFTRATFSPGPSTDKQIQLPALFSSLRVPRLVPEPDTGVTEKQGDSKVQSSFLDQISQFLSREKKGDEKEEQREMKPEGDEDETKEKHDNEQSQEISEKKDLENKEDKGASSESPKPPVSSAEAAFDAFKAFFTPKPLKKNPADKADLEAVRKKISTEKDVLRAFFERTSNKTLEKRRSSDVKVCTVFPKGRFKHVLYTRICSFCGCF